MKASKDQSCQWYNTVAVSREVKEHHAGDQPHHVIDYTQENLVMDHFV